MSTPTLATSANTSFRSLVVPREHGSWSLALEPVALGLLVAPTRAGVWLALAVIAGFFTRRPLKLTWTLEAGDERRQPALRWMLLFAGLALGALAVAGQFSSGRALWPLLLAAPFGAAFLWFDLRNAMREAEAELAGCLAFAVVPAAFATLAGWRSEPALALAALMCARSVPTVLTVRLYLRLAKGRPSSLLPALASAAAVFALSIGLFALHLIPAAAVGLVGLLTARTTFLLSPFAPAWSARQVGLTEAIVGLVYLAGLALTYQGQWVG